MPHASTDQWEAAQLLAAEIAADTARVQHRQRDLIRHRGVNWSGLGPEAIAPRPRASLHAAAEAKLASRRSWGASPKGRLLSIIAACQAAASRAHAVGERARAGAARDEPLEWCGQALQDLSGELQTLANRLDETRRAISDG